MNITPASEDDYSYIIEHDHHLPKAMVMTKINAREIYMIREPDGFIIGWMRFSFFWDNTPFMNMVWIDEGYRGNGIGRRVVALWEDEMKRQGYERVLTSTLSNEEAQHFYRKLGYRDAGCLLLENEPLEIFFAKML